MTQDDLSPGLSSARASLVGGRPQEALATVRVLLDRGTESPALHGLHAQALLKTGDEAGAEAAADRALSLDVREARALCVKGDILSRRGELRDANAYYGGLMRVLEGAPTLDADLKEGLARARELRQRVTGDMMQTLQGELQGAGFNEERSHPRFRHALDLALGRRALYMPQPKAFYYPELPASQFYPRADFPWLDGVEAATDAMLAELNGVLGKENESFSPYVQTMPNMPKRPGDLLIDSMDWSACFLWRDGRETAYAARCPQTMAALADAPLCRIRGRSPQVMFSQLKAGARIPAHHGYVNTRLVCHVPLIVPEGCRFRVGNDTRHWQRGEAWVFDDTIEHEAMNDSASDRVILIFDIWHPALSEEERHLVGTLLEAMDAYSPNPATWE
ncbi:aspartyl/asparaginyl beta-hydroxylase domain-containing protein [Brevundimonas halotolerans]|uniref:Aspartyl/asparaginyl beta-hydroxylase (Cupin superfamily) n=1 Tax=Brevundimonas halotolerans TaxID=69670 RepID=A0A7W9A4E2_9CAUL|nr:aspartyl/asparaginyl beta-hydroxylase domain-containing protein [Brevundimonas halotolerans]MBB5661242.1 aspartyl/asparaginyl beta-hydroxylase (cupin superfamily) [Brevundimonas halotolerans]